MLTISGDPEFQSKLLQLVCRRSVRGLQMNGPEQAVRRSTVYFCTQRSRLFWKDMRRRFAAQTHMLSGEAGRAHRRSTNGLLREPLISFGLTVENWSIGIVRRIALPYLLACCGSQLDCCYFTILADE